MSGYKLEGPKPARMYEVILPKKLGYFGKVQEVLEDLFDEQAIRAIPFVKKSIARRKSRPEVRRGSLGQVTLPGFPRLLDLRDGRPLPLGQRPRGRARAGHPVHLPQSRGPEGLAGRISWRPRSRWSTTWWRIGSPTSLASRKKSGFLNITSRSSRSGAGPSVAKGRDPGLLLETSP